MSVLIALCVCTLVCRCVGVVHPCGVRGCLLILIFCLKYLHRPPASQAESVRFRSALVVHSRNWISSPLNAICIEQTFAPAIIGNHDALVVGTTITAGSGFSFMYANTTPTKDGCGKSGRVVSYVVVKYVFPGCAVRLKPRIEDRGVCGHQVHIDRPPGFLQPIERDLRYPGVLRVFWSDQTVGCPVLL